ncbi:MAG: uroporphyrinogen-III C-methyltransferase [Gammaproteobacteria bacterium]
MNSKEDSHQEKGAQASGVEVESDENPPIDSAAAGDSPEAESGAASPPEEATEAEIVAESAETAPPPSSPKPSSGRWGVAALVVAVIALLLTVGIAGFGYYRVQQLEQGVAAMMPAIERNAGRIAGVEQSVKQLGESLGQRLDAQKSAFERQDRALQEALGALREQLGRDQSGWVLAEVEYLLLVANHRLRLEGDVSTALAALEIADDRLREIGDPALIDIREKIAKERVALKSLSLPDRSGLALTLSGLVEQVDRLPLKDHYRPAAAPAGGQRAVEKRAVEGWRELAGAVWGDLKGLVTVRHREEAVRPMLAPEQQYFLRQNLRLQLESARLALLRADQAQFEVALKTAREWIPDYFDERAAPAQAMLTELERIGGVRIDPPMPDISGSLNALREHMRRTEKQE